MSDSMSKPLKILLDTNIWLDIYFPDRHEHPSSKAVVDAALNKGCDLYFTSDSLVTIFYLAQRIQKSVLRNAGIELTDSLTSAANEVAWGCIENIYEIASPVPSSIPALFLAMKMKDIHSDFEDDLVLASAETVGIDFLVTNDKLLISKATVPTLSSKDMVAYLNSGCC